MAYPEHGRLRFYKYVPSETAEKILQSRCVRYSSPRRFNDPFDVQSGLHLDFDLGSLPDRLLDRYKEIVQSHKQPNIDPSNVFGQIALLLWQHRSNGIPEALQTQLLGQSKELSAIYLTFQKRYQQMWWDDYLPRLRVFCVTEEKDNLLMWSHYAASHTGVVFEFAVLPEQDNPLCVAKKTMYQKHPEPLFTLDQLLEDATGIRSLDREEMLQRFRDYAYLKSDVWAYEKEWRVWDLPANGNGELYSDYPLRDNEVAAVYFGCKSTIADREKISSLTYENFPNAKLFLAAKAEDSFSLLFEPI